MKKKQREVSKTLIAGPWVGEFGWELFAWQAYIRALSENFDRTVCLAREASRFLYEDFADEFISYDTTDGAADSFFMHNHVIDKRYLGDIFKRFSGGTITWVPPKRIGMPPHTHYDEKQPFGILQVKPKYIKFGAPAEKKDHIIFHARSRDLREEDNWSSDSWKKLASFFVKDGREVYSIGTLEQSLHVEGTIDLRGAPLKETTRLLAEAGAALGPSSGPMHLASLCGCPHVVWSINSNFERYTKNWNPHQTSVLFLDEYEWNPAPKYVYSKYKEWRKEKVL